MRLRNYSEEYIKEQMDDFREFAQVIHDTFGYRAYSVDTIATLYTAMKREIPRENSGYSSY